MTAAGIVLTIGAVKLTLSFLLASSFLSIPGYAQEAPLPEPQPGTFEAGVESFSDSLLIADALQLDATDAAEPAARPETLPTDNEPGRHGKWRLAPHLHAKGTYDDNIFIQPENQVADYILTLAPGLALGFWDSDEERERYLERQYGTTVVERSRGTFLVVDYTAILLGFARTTSQNTLDHDALIETRWERDKLTLGARLHLESKSETNTDIGDRIRRKTLAAAVTSNYQLTEKTALGLGLYNTANDPEDFVRTVEQRVETSLDYSATPSLQLGLGVAAGRVQVETSDDQIFERLLARAAYSLSEKLELEFRGGVEFRQSDGLPGDRTNPIFELRADWTPRAGTQVGLEAFRRVEASAARPDQDFTLTGIRMNVRQALKGGVHLGVEGGYHNASYTPIGDDDSRTDRYFFVRPGLFYSFASWGNAGISYEHRHNDSDRTASNFENNLTTLEVRLMY